MAWTQRKKKLEEKLKTLRRLCGSVLPEQCGASAVRQLLDRQIQPLKVVDNSSIKELIMAFQKELKEGALNLVSQSHCSKKGLISR